MATDQHHHPSSHGDDGPGPLNHETTDISLDGVGKLTVGFVVVLLVVSAAMYGTYRLLDRRASAADVPVSKMDRGYGTVAPAPLMDKPNALDVTGRQPAGPKILTDEPAWLREVRAQQTSATTTYGWVNKETGVVRLPLERAKQLILEAGLPSTAAPAPASEPATAAPGPAGTQAPAATPPPSH
jgi:hypothetical protein